MNQSLNQFTLKGGLADNAFGWHITLENTVLVADKKERYAIFFSRALDSGQIDMTWNRFLLRIVKSANLTYFVHVKSANEKTFYHQGTSYSVEEFLNSSQIPPEKKLQFFSEDNGGEYYANCDDVLLYRLKGRYLWIALELYYDVGNSVCIKDLIVEFPMDNFIRYLPEIYRDNYDFTSRFLAIAATEFTDLNEKIDTFEQHLDLSLANEENLSYLSSWIGAEEKILMLPAQKMRDFLKKSVYFSSRKGTPSGIQQVVEFLVEGQVRIAEYHNFEYCYPEDMEKTEFLKNILINENYFAVILEEDCFSQKATKGQVELFLQYYKPALAKPVIVYEIKSTDNKTDTNLSLELGIRTMPKAVLDMSNQMIIGKSVIEE